MEGEGGQDLLGDLAGGSGANDQGEAMRPTLRSGEELVKLSQLLEHKAQIDNHVVATFKIEAERITSKEHPGKRELAWLNDFVCTC